MRISIITPSYNQADYLEETMMSVFNQRYPDLEYIVIDGGSTDGSVDLIKKHQHKLAYWTSEKDRGQSHAVNKGLEKATGDVVAFLNSDDVYLPGAFNTVAAKFTRDSSCHWIAGGWGLFGNTPDIATDYRSPHPPASPAHALFLKYDAAQPSHFWRRSLFEKYGHFDESFRYGFDHEFIVRLLIAGEHLYCIPAPLSGYRLHPTSKTVAEGSGFEPEWESIRQRYKDRVPANQWLTVSSETQRSQKTHLQAEQFHKALYALSTGGRWSAVRTLFDVIKSQPESLFSKATLRCTKRILLGRT